MHCTNYSQGYQATQHMLTAALTHAPSLKPQRALSTTVVSETRTHTYTPPKIRTLGFASAISSHSTKQPQKRTERMIDFQVCACAVASYLTLANWEPSGCLDRLRSQQDRLFLSSAMISIVQPEHSATDLIGQRTLTKTYACAESRGLRTYICTYIEAESGWQCILGIWGTGRISEDVWVHTIATCKLVLM